MNGLKHCPVCGSRNITYNRTSKPKNNDYTVVCKECGKTFEFTLIDDNSFVNQSEKKPAPKPYEPPWPVRVKKSQHPLFGYHQYCVYDSPISTIGLFDGETDAKFFRAMCWLKRTWEHRGLTGYDDVCEWFGDIEKYIAGEGELPE